jgi:hypothetical protein
LHTVKELWQRFIWLFALRLSIKAKHIEQEGYRRCGAEWLEVPV